ncbi:MAG: sigma-70 family RNA polymerase sigma factor [Emticicia sp.]|nr:sigma-70 family RNA polymerase sigma factor [Emticicia sp.]
MDFNTIIDGCRHNNRTAQKALYNRYLGTLYRLSLRYVRDVSDAEDCTSESFVKIFEKIQTFDYKEINSFEVWMKQIVINQSLMCLRKRNSFVMLDISEIIELGNDVYLDENLDAKQILELIKDLPDGYRTVFNLYAIEGFTHIEIAKMLGISENTSKTQLHKARLLLQKKLMNELGIRK